MWHDLFVCERWLLEQVYYICIYVYTWLFWEKLTLSPWFIFSAFKSFLSSKLSFQTQNFLFPIVTRRLWQFGLIYFVFNPWVHILKFWRISTPVPRKLILQKATQTQEYSTNFNSRGTGCRWTFSRILRLNYVVSSPGSPCSVFLTDTEILIEFMMSGDTIEICQKVISHSSFLTQM